MYCVLYARVSTEKQAERELSIPAQLEAMRQYALQRNWQIVEEFVEAGESGRTAARPVLRRLLGKCRDVDAAVEVVLVHKVDRLARNVADHAAIRVLLQKRGIRLASVTENLDGSVSGQLVENIMAAIAEFYSANLADEVRKGLRQKVLKGGWPHMPPRGYVAVRSSDGNVLREHPVDGVLIRRAFELCATGWYSVGGLASRLAQEGLTNRAGRPLSPSHVRRILTNPFYTGRIQWQDLNVAGQQPVLLSQELFDKVQKVLASKRHDSERRTRLMGFPLRGTAVCACCRGHMTAERHQRWDYYRCSRKAYRPTACSARFCNAARAHADLLRICAQLPIAPSLLQSIGAATLQLLRKRADARSTEAETLKTEQAEFRRTEMQLTEAFVAGFVTPSTYRAKQAELQERQATLQRTSEALAGDVGLRARIEKILTSVENVADLYLALDDQGQRELLRVVFSGLVLDQRGIVGFSLKVPFDSSPSQPLVESTEQLAELLLVAA